MVYIRNVLKNTTDIFILCLYFHHTYRPAYLLSCIPKNMIFFTTTVYPSIPVSKLIFLNTYAPICILLKLHSSSKSLIFLCRPVVHTLVHPNIRHHISIIHRTLCPHYPIYTFKPTYPLCLLPPPPYLSPPLLCLPQTTVSFVPIIYPLKITCKILSSRVGTLSLASKVQLPYPRFQWTRHFCFSCFPLRLPA